MARNLAVIVAASLPLQALLVVCADAIFFGARNSNESEFRYALGFGLALAIGMTPFWFVAGSLGSWLRGRIGPMG